MADDTHESDEAYARWLQQRYDRGLRTPSPRLQQHLDRQQEDMRDTDRGREARTPTPSPIVLDSPSSSSSSSSSSSGGSSQESYLTLEFGSADDDAAPDDDGRADTQFPDATTTFRDATDSTANAQAAASYAIDLVNISSSDSEDAGDAAEASADGDGRAAGGPRARRHRGAVDVYREVCERAQAETGVPTILYPAHAVEAHMRHRVGGGEGIRLHGDTVRQSPYLATHARCSCRAHVFVPGGGGGAGAAMADAGAGNLAFCSRCTCVVCGIPPALCPAWAVHCNFETGDAVASRLAQLAAEANCAARAGVLSMRAAAREVNARITALKLPQTPAGAAMPAAGIERAGTYGRRPPNSVSPSQRLACALPRHAALPVLRAEVTVYALAECDADATDALDIVARAGTSARPSVLRATDGLAAAVSTALRGGGAEPHGAGSGDVEIDGVDSRVPCARCVASSTRIAQRGGAAPTCPTFALA